MSIPIRICFVYVSKLFDMLSEEELPYNFFDRWWFDMRPELNITWIRGEGQGVLRDPETFRYDGCIGSMQRNESDYGSIMTPEDYYGSNVSIWNTMFSDHNTIGTAYNKSLTTEKTTRVLDFLNAYTFQHWLFTISFMIFMYVIIMMQMSGRRKRKYNLKERIMKSFRDANSIAVSCILNQHGSCGNVRMQPMTNWIYTFMTLLGFFTGYFLTSMIKTEMVVREPPPIFQSYQDILDNEVTPMWDTETYSHRLFQDAVPGSVENRIWQRANERGINESVISASHIVGEPITGMQLFLEFAHRERVALLARLITQILETTACALMRSTGTLNEVNLFARTDADAAEFLRVMLGSASVRDDIRKLVSRKMNRKFEMGTWVHYVLHRFSFMVASNEGHVVEVEECSGNTIVVPDYDMESVMLFHYRDLFLLCFILLMISVLIGMVEMRFMPRRSVKRIRLLV